MQETGLMLGDRAIDVDSTLRIERFTKGAMFVESNQTQVLHVLSTPGPSFIATFEKTDYPSPAQYEMRNDWMDGREPTVVTSHDKARVMFATFIKQAIPKLIEEEPVKLHQFGESSFVVPQNGIMSKLGATAAVAAGLFLETDPDMGATLDINLSGCGYRMYSTRGLLAWSKPSNWVRFTGQNHDTGRKASFDFSARPLSGTGLAVASTELKIGIPEEDNFMEVVRNQLVSPSRDVLASNRSRYRRTPRGEKSQEELLESEPGSFDTSIIAMAVQAAAVLKGN